MGGPSSSGSGVKGIFRTTNGGESWTLVRNLFFSRPSISERGGVAFAFAPNGVIFAGSHADGLYKSTDDGATWVPVRTSDESTVLFKVRINDVKVSPADASLVILSTSSGLYRVNDFGSSASVIGIGTGLPAAPHVTVINPNNPEIIYSAVASSGVFRSTDGGFTFSSRSSGLSGALSAGKKAQYLAISPVDPNYMYIGFNMVDVFYSHDAGSSWQKPASMDDQNAYGWVSGSMTNTSTSTGSWGSSPIAPHPTNRDLALLSGHSYHIKNTNDGGVNWRYGSSGYTGAAVVGLKPFSWHPGNPQRFAFFLTDYGAYLTNDGGSTFKNLDLPRYLGQVTSLSGAIDPTPESETIVTATGTWRQQVIAVTHDEGATWKLFSDVGTYSFIVFHPQESNIVYANHLKSTDKGNTWNALSRSIVAMFPSNGDIVYATENEGTSTRIYKSTDAGSTWSSPFPPIPVNDSVGETVYQIAIDPVDSNRIYATVDHRGVYVIQGSSISLKDVSAGLERDQFGQLHFRYVASDPTHPKIVYASTYAPHLGQTRGIFRSTDSGESWLNINSNLGPHFSAAALSVNPANGFVYAGSFHGTLRLPPRPM